MVRATSRASRRDFISGFIVGFVGLSILLSSVSLLVRISTTLPQSSLTDRYRSEQEDTDIQYEGNETEKEDSVRYRESSNDDFNETESSVVFDNLTDEVTTDFHKRSKKRPLLIVMHSSRSEVNNTHSRVHSTWGGEETKNYIIVTGKSGLKAEEVPSNVMELDHNDFPSTVHLTHEELVFILMQVRQHFVHTYWWFFLVPSNTYVSPDRIYELLTGLDPNKMIYLGHPSSQLLESDKSYCRAGPGILLSYSSLEMIDRNVGYCIREKTGKHSDVALGECLIEFLHIECYKNNVNLEKIFFYDLTALSRMPSVLWLNETFQELATLYPVQDYHQFEALHAWNQARKISHHSAKAAEAFERLVSSSLCDDSIPECGLNLTDDIFSEISYNQFSTNCTLFSRGYITDVRRWIDIWDIAMGNNIYSGKNIEPQELVYGWMTEELHYATSVAMELVKQEDSNLELRNIANSYIRHKGTVGQEFILDLELVKLGEKSEKSLFKRVALLFPFHQEFQFMNNTMVVKKLNPIINLIVPFSGALKRRKLTAFIKVCYHLCVNMKGNCKIVFVLFESVGRRIQVIKKYINRYGQKYSRFVGPIVHDTGQFDQKKGYDLGLSLLSDDDLAVLMDLEIRLTTNFLGRCRQYAIRGHQVYFPDIFRFYNMKYVHPKVKWSLRHFSFIRNHGHWAKHSLLCLYKSDYMDLGKFNQISKWEMQPELIPSTSKGGLNVIQSPDPGVSHAYGETKCDSSMPSAQFSFCLTQRRDDLGDRTVLANYALSLEEKCKEERGLPPSKIL